MSASDIGYFDDYESPDIKQDENQRSMLVNAIQLMGKEYVGREFLRWLMEKTKVFEQEFPKDLTLVAWNAGLRTVGLEILSLCSEANVLQHVLTKEVVENE